MGRPEWDRSDTFVFKINFNLFYAKMVSCMLICPKVPPDPLPPPYLVQIQDSELLTSSLGIIVE